MDFFIGWIMRGIALVVAELATRRQRLALHFVNSIDSLVIKRCSTSSSVVRMRQDGLVLVGIEVGRVT
jgi:hypothetical protein